MQRKILVSYELARWTFAWNVLRKPSVSSWVWQPAVRLAATTRRFTSHGDPRITFSWTTNWCHRRSTHLSKNERADGRKTSAHHKSNSRPSVSRLPRYYRAKSVDRVGLSIVDRRPRRPSIPSTRPTMSSRTTPIRIRLAASILPGEDPRNCNLSISFMWLFVCIRLRRRNFEESLRRN